METCVTCFNLIRPLCIYMRLLGFVDVCVCVCRVFCSHCHQGVRPRWRQDAKEISSRSRRPWYVPRPTHFPLYVYSCAVYTLLSLCCVCTCTMHCLDLLGVCSIPTLCIVQQFLFSNCSSEHSVHHHFVDFGSPPPEKMLCFFKYCVQELIGILFHMAFSRRFLHRRRGRYSRLCCKVPNPSWGCRGLGSDGAILGAVHIQVPPC